MLDRNESKRREAMLLVYVGIGNESNGHDMMIRIYVEIVGWYGNSNKIGIFDG